MTTVATTMGLLLAAGGSSRLGRPKQLLPWNDSTLVHVAIDRMLEARVDEIIVVLGGNGSEVEDHLRGHLPNSVRLVYNERWQTGQASSLQRGLSIIATTFESPPNVLVTLCDQPLIETAHLRRLIDAINGDIRCSATAYPHGGGVPACFRGDVVQALVIDAADSGAKDWIRAQPRHQISLLCSPGATTDIDTAADYARISHGRSVSD